MTSDRKGNTENVLLDGEIERETEKAWFFYDGSRRVWLPKSQCEWYKSSKVMSCPEWLAKEKGLI